MNGYLTMVGEAKASAKEMGELKLEKPDIKQVIGLAAGNNKMVNLSIRLIKVNPGLFKN
ncbi:MAG: hypothetical protein GXY86_00325 [Firmicutes bacterium]|nr:hypothetical protein [Bacillota bacterium]